MINCGNEDCLFHHVRYPHNCSQWDPHITCGFSEAKPREFIHPYDGPMGSDCDTCQDPVDFAGKNGYMRVDGYECLPETKAEGDMVNEPKHYEMYPEHGIEVRDVIKTAIQKNISDPVQAAWYKDTLKYLLRCGCKGNYLQDLKKAQIYLEWLIEEVGEDA